jgi:predicted ester cyclase
VKEFYRRYLQCCNDHRFGELGEFVAERVEINGVPGDLAGYGAGLLSVVDNYPDFHWHLQHVLVEGEWMSARLVDTYTGDDGPRALQEFAFYRVSGGRIVQVWGDLDRDRL